MPCQAAAAAVTQPWLQTQQSRASHPTGRKATGSPVLPGFGANTCTCCAHAVTKGDSHADTSGPSPDCHTLSSPACCCLSAAASASSCGSFWFRLSCTCLPRLLLLSAVSRVTGAAAAMRMAEDCSPVLDTSLMVSRPTAGVGHHQK